MPNVYEGLWAFGIVATGGKGKHLVAFIVRTGLTRVNSGCAWKIFLRFYMVRRLMLSCVSAWSVMRLLTLGRKSAYRACCVIPRFSMRRQVGIKGTMARHHYGSLPKIAPQIDKWPTKKTGSVRY